ncbi:MAG: MerR family transcriptional regulator [Burkholderiaceae bacterium]
MPIGTVAELTGRKPSSIRYYEQIGLLPPAPRTAAGQRHYDEAAIRRLAFIRRCRDFGFPIEQVRALVRLVDDPGLPCVEVRDIAAAQLADVRRRLAELRALEAGLAGFVRRCENACAGGRTVDCTVLEDLAAPAGQARRVEPGACCGS